MITTELWPLAREALNALSDSYGPALTGVFSAAGAEARDWAPLYRALLFDPQPVRAQDIAGGCAPYTAAHVFEEQFRGAAERGLLDAHGDGYRLSAPGRDLIRRSLDAARAHLAALPALPPDDADRLAALLRRLVDAVLAAPEPPGQACIRLNRRADPGDDAPALARVDQYLSDLSDYRDDVHLGAWRFYKVEGPAWEAFTLLWREGPASLAGLADKLPRRGFAAADYANALHGLAERGWIEESGGAYRVTDKGAALRQQVEAATDRSFYTPWSVLGPDEVRDLRDLLTRLRDGLK